MLDENLFNKVYVDYTLYSVIKLKDKYGFKIKLYFNDGTDDIIQMGGFNKKGDATKERDKVASPFLLNHTFVVQPKIKFEVYIRYWLNNVMKPKLKYNSFISYRNVVENYAIPFLGNLNIIQINMGHIQRFYNDTASKYKSIALLAKTIMETAMEYAKSKNLIEVNPACNVSLPKDIETQNYKTLIINEEKVLNVEQIRTLIEASKETPIHLQVLFAVLMGLRKQEINAIKYTDIDFVNRKLYLKVQLGRKTEDTADDCPKKMLTKQEIKLKSYHSERVLDIPDILFEAILNEKQKYERNRHRRINDKTNPFYDHNYVCCSTYGKPRSKDFHRRYYIKLLKDNNLPNIGFHDLRHTYTTLLLLNNHNIKAVSELLGHASIVVTSNHYFDKNKLIIDCTDVLNNYINRVKPIELLSDNLVPIVADLDTNFMVNRFV